MIKKFINRIKTLRDRVNENPVSDTKISTLEELKSLEEVKQKLQELGLSFRSSEE